MQGRRGDRQQETSVNAAASLTKKRTTSPGPGEVLLTKIDRKRLEEQNIHLGSAPFAYCVRCVRRDRLHVS